MTAAGSNERLRSALAALKASKAQKLDSRSSAPAVSESPEGQQPQEGSAAQHELAADARPRAVLDVLGYPAASLVELPVDFVLVLAHPQAGTFYALTRLAYSKLRAKRRIVLTGAEWLALCVGAESERACAELGVWLLRKRTEAHNELTLDQTLGQVASVTAANPRWSTERVIRAWDVSLTDVVFTE